MTRVSFLLFLDGGSLCVLVVRAGVPLGLEMLILGLVSVCLFCVITLFLVPLPAGLLGVVQVCSYMFVVFI